MLVDLAASRRFVLACNHSFFGQTIFDGLVIAPSAALAALVWFGTRRNCCNAVPFHSAYTG
jgi:hypothetical protein